MAGYVPSKMEDVVTTECKRVDCELEVTAMVDCPNEECGDTFDLFKLERLTDEGYLYRELLSDKGFGKENFGEMVKCPACGEIFVIGDVSW